jgi:hypothetical protein
LNSKQSLRFPMCDPVRQRFLRGGGVLLDHTSRELL